MDLIHRPRRMRRTRLIRELCAETILQPRRLIQPYFVSDG
ncbi:MAG: porphobilinogen synthase, partial [Candidatus Zixiibacteriota bacterium]